jgi:hypothetical protein
VPQYWAGFSEGRIDTREVDNGFEGWGENKHRAPAIFTSRSEALRHYEDVFKVEVRVVSKKKAKRKPKTTLKEKR